MTDAELSALEAAASAATPGPWECDALSTVRSMDENYRGIGIVYCAIDSTGRVPSLNNAAYIAAANPAAILELIAELRQVRKELEWLVKNTHINNCPDCRNMESCLKHSDCEVCWIQAAKEAVCQKK